MNAAVELTQNQRTLIKLSAHELSVFGRPLDHTPHGLRHDRALRRRRALHLRPVGPQGGRGLVFLDKPIEGNPVTSFTLPDYSVIWPLSSIMRCWRKLLTTFARRGGPEQEEAMKNILERTRCRGTPNSWPNSCPPHAAIRAAHNAEHRHPPR